MADMHYTARVPSMDADDTEDWLKRQHAMQRQWQAEDAAAAQELGEVSCAPEPSHRARSLDELTHRDAADE
jgi:hypothetical protein